MMYWEWLECDTRREQGRYLKQLRLGRDQVKACKSALGKIVHVVHTHVKLEKGIPIDHVKTCGSIGKRTASSQSSDLDLVVFINGILEPDDDVRPSLDISSILQDIQTALDRQYPDTRDTDWYQKFGLRYVIQGMEIDILIGATNVTPRDFLDVLEDQEQRAYMSASVSHYSTKFMAKQGLFFKDMVRLIKDWRDSYPSWPPNCKPKSYLLEVLVLHAIRQALPNLYSERTNRVRDYFTGYFRNAERLLLSFFDMIGDIKPYRSNGNSYSNKNTVSLCVFFEAFYREDEIPWDQPEPLFRIRINKRGKRNMTRYASAVVLDPANPTNNLWLTLSDANPFILRAKNTALVLRNNE
jgi:hypothetical protein